MTATGQMAQVAPVHEKAHWHWHVRDADCSETVVAWLLQSTRRSHVVAFGRAVGANVVVVEVVRGASVALVVVV